MEITQTTLKKLFDYQDGRLYWKEARGNVSIGQQAGTVNGIGYRQITIDKKIHLEHRLIFLYHHGHLPNLPRVIDHIDRNPQNNTIENLRIITHRKNLQRAGKGKRGSSEFKGVSWNQKQQKWLAYIYDNGKNRYLGSFESESEAAESYNSAVLSTFGEMAFMNDIREEI